MLTDRPGVTFPATGATMWDDLFEDQPWMDEAAEADRAQSIDANAGVVRVLLRERYGLLAGLALEVMARPSTPPAPRYDDSELTIRRRRRILSECLDGEAQSGAA